MARSPKSSTKQIDALKHEAATRRNIPTAEMESFFQRDEDSAPRPPIHYPRARPLAEGEHRTAEAPGQPELLWNGARITITKAQMEELVRTGTLTLADAQLVWRGKDRQDWSDLVVNVPPLYIQEKIHPKAIIDDLKSRTAQSREAVSDTPDLFADFNGITPEQRAEFYQHDQHWSNRMILGDALQVMASLAERESLRGKVQCIYFDPPYGIKFNSNWQVSTQSRDVKDGKQTDISREPEQVKAFRDTWKDGIHSYLTYLRDRLTVMRDLLTESGSIFVQIGDEHVHRVRSVLDEVFGVTNFVSMLIFKKTGGQSASAIANVNDFILWYAKDRAVVRTRPLYMKKVPGEEGATNFEWLEDTSGTRRPMSAREKERDVALPQGCKIMQPYPMFSDGPSQRDRHLVWRGTEFKPSSNSHWKTHNDGLQRASRADRFVSQGKTLRFINYLTDYNVTPLLNMWTDTQTSGFGADRVYIVQTLPKVIERCILMATDPGDLVLDPTCGSGTTAYVAEQWGRRWITIDTSRVALALARTRLMAARYPWYLLADSLEGRAKEAALQQRVLPDTPLHNDIRQGFVYERVPHITLKSIANNPLIDEIWERWQEVLEPLRATLNASLPLAGRVARSAGWGADAERRVGEHGRTVSSVAPDTPPGAARHPPREGEGYEEWEIPREVDPSWGETARTAHAQWWEARIARQREIDASIAARADVEYLFDKPYTYNARVRVAGPFTVESLSPHRVLPASEDELLGDPETTTARAGQDFSTIVIDYLKAEGVKQAQKADRIIFESLTPWPGHFVGAEGKFIEGENGPERRAAILIGPEYGTVGRQDVVRAAREAADAQFDLLIACAFNFDAHSTELGSLGSLKIIKARINPDMHMSAELKNTGRGNMFVVFGEPDVDIIDDGGETLRVKVNGVDVFDPNTGDIRSNDTAGIAAWFIDTEYNDESFFVRHAYFLGANDPYKCLKTALQAEIDEDAWATLYSDTSRPFDRPASGRIAVKVISHFGDEVMKVFPV